MTTNRQTILVVEPSPIVRKLWNTTLFAAAFDVVAAADAPEALRCAADRVPDLVLVALDLPDSPAAALVERLRALPGCSGLRAIAVADSEAALQRARSTTADFDDHLLASSIGPASVDRIRAALTLPDASEARRGSLRESELAVLQAIFDALSGSLESDRALEDLLVRGLATDGLSLGGIYLLDSDQQLQLVAHRADPLIAPRLHDFFGSMDVLENAIAGAAQLAFDSGSGPDLVRIARATGLESLLALPLVFGGEALGAFVVGSARRDLTAGHWPLFVRGLADRFAQAIVLMRALQRPPTTDQRYRILMETANGAITIASANGILREVNGQCEALLRTPREQLVGTKYLDLVEPRDRATAEAAFARVLSEGRARTVVHVRRGDGGSIPVDVHGSCATVGDERLVLGIVRDVTARLDVEEQLARQRQVLAQTEKLAALGSLLAGVAHELNNPLSAVVAHSELLVSSGGANATERAKEIARAADRCAKIVGNVLAIAAGHAAKGQRTQLNDAAAAAAEVAAYGLHVDDIELDLRLAPEIPDVALDAHQLQQVVLNLVTNAHHALQQVSGPRRIAITTSVDPEHGRAFLEVANNGPEVPEEVRARIFEPFFTTKPAGVGTGLGLSICRSTLQRQGGSVQLVDRPGWGAVFRVDVPLAEAERDPPRPAVTERRGPQRLRVLVVEDEISVGALVSEVLGQAGHQVDVACSGQQGLELVERHAYDVILSDVHMPGMHGPAFHAAAIARQPELAGRFLFLTGDALRTETREFLERSGARHVAKPFHVAELVAAVESLPG